MKRSRFELSRQTFFLGQALSGAMGVMCCFIMGMKAAHAECPPEAPPEAPITNDSGREAAQALFKAGIELRVKKDWARALVFFLQSRAIERRVASTWNAAHCLNLLQRYPEALAFYEEIQRDFSEKLTPEKKAEIQKAIADLRSKIVIAEIQEKSGLYAVDGSVCGELPRKSPIYLLPGRHRLRIWQSGQVEAIVEFEGKPGEKKTLQVPRELEPKGQWFVRGSMGYGFGSWPGESMAGVVMQTRDGYRFSNQLSLGLTLGLGYFGPGLDSEGERKDLPSGDGTVASADRPYFLREIRTLAPFMGISAGWEPKIDKHLKGMFALGMGVMGAQSKSVIDIVRGTERNSIDDEIVNGVRVIEATGRNVVRSAIPYASFDVGLMFHYRKLYLGAAIGMFFVIQDGFQKVPVAPVVFREGDRVNTVTFSEKTALGESILLLPQIVVGFDP